MIRACIPDDLTTIYDDHEPYLIVYRYYPSWRCIAFALGMAILIGNPLFLRRVSLVLDAIR